MSYVYIESEHNANGSLYTVGFYDPDGKFTPETDFDDSEKAAERVAYLNGTALVDETQISEVNHYQIHQRYKIQFGVGATKGVTGWKVEANSDSLEDVMSEAKSLKEYAERMTAIPGPAVTNA